MNPEQQKIYLDAYRAAVAALRATVAYRQHRTAANAQKAEAANTAVSAAATAASEAKADLEYGEAYERLEEAACCAEIVWIILTNQVSRRMTRTSLAKWADQIVRSLADQGFEIENAGLE